MKKISILKTSLFLCLILISSFASLSLFSVSFSAPLFADETALKSSGQNSSNHALIFMTDFGLKDSAVCSMKGVAFGVDSNLKMFDLTHEIPPYNVWEGAYRLKQVLPFWPQGSVFIAVVDPGVGTERKSIVMKTKNGLYFAAPDNGLLTFAAEDLGVAEVREIDENTNRLPGSNNSYTFFGRDVFAYTAARLASGRIKFEEIGPVMKKDLILLKYQKPVLKDNKILGNIPVLDTQYGNVWTNIDAELFSKINVKTGESINIKILNDDKVVYEGSMIFCNTFGDVKEGENLAYLNSLMNLSFAINMGNFSEKYKISSGAQWSINAEKLKVKSEK